MSERRVPEKQSPKQTEAVALDDNSPHLEQTTKVRKNDEGFAKSSSVSTQRLRKNVSVYGPLPPSTKSVSDKSNA